MTSSPRRYSMNYNWIWGPENPLLDKTAKLCLQIHDVNPDRFGDLLRQWLATLTCDEGGWFRGGWAVDVVAHERGSAELLFSSGGQDVADSLQDGVDSFHDQVLAPLSPDPLTPGTVSWTELPLR
ncbi:hypothetical protein [Arthrobacter alpinus]|uniref:hypothetical protein n=1 Tax=Arthrobacter alpinus TaxID=656366 RepID=UPI0012FEB5AE|nr:hypothetical protein [Arthrobacter alpinus]